MNALSDEASSAIIAKIKKLLEPAYSETLTKVILKRLPPDSNLTLKPGEVKKIQKVLGRAETWPLLLHPSMNVSETLRDVILTCLSPDRPAHLNDWLASEIAALAMAEFTGTLSPDIRANVFAESLRVSADMIRGNAHQLIEIRQLLAQNASTAATTVASGVAQYRRMLSTALTRRHAQHHFHIRYQVSGQQFEDIDLHDLLTERTWIAIHSKAGSGKSELILREAIRLTTEQNLVVIFLDLKRWSNALSDENVSSVTLDDILECSIVPINLEAIQNLTIGWPDGPIWQVWFVDGVNELPSDLSGHVLSTVTNYLRSKMSASLCVTDRYDARYQDPNWTRVELLNLDWTEVERHIRGRAYQLRGAVQNDLLRTPFFLEIAIDEGRWEWGNSVQAIHSLFIDRVKLNEQQLDQLATFALSVYAGRHGLRFNILTLAQETSPIIARKLFESGLLIAGNDTTVTFYHQLLHDYLCSRAVYDQPDSWVPRTFDALSFAANTYDSIFMVLNQLPNGPMVTRYITALYDWNWFGTIRCAERALYDKIALPEDLLVTLSAILAEKRFDRVHGSRVRANEWISRLDAHTGFSFATKPRIHDVVDEAVRNAPVDRAPWFNTWLSLFKTLKSPEELLSEDEIALLGDANPFIGWTASQAIRWKMSEEILLTQVRSLYRGARYASDDVSQSVRWRAVHALGSHPSQQNIRLLLSAIDNDPYSWVVYGAVRSLLEMAALSGHDVADSIVSAVDSRLETLPPEPLGEVAWVTRYDREQPGWKSNWARQIWPLLEHAYNVQTDEISKELWKGRLEAFQRWVNQEPSSG